MLKEIHRYPSLKSVSAFALLVMFGWLGSQSASGLSWQSSTAPVIVSLELRTADCVPYILAVPADSEVQLSILNRTDVDRIVILPPNGRYITVSTQGIEVVNLRLNTGDYRILCGPTDNVRAAAVDIALVDPRLLDDPAVVLATPNGAPGPSGSPQTT